MKKRLIRGGLQHRLILSVMLVFCMPILLIGCFILNSLHEKLMANAQVSARTAITTVQQEITHTLTNAQDSLSLLASDDELYYFFSRSQPELDVLNMYLQKISANLNQIQLQYPALNLTRILHQNESVFKIRDAVVRVDDINTVTDAMKSADNKIPIKSIQFSLQPRPWGNAEETNVWYINHVVPAAQFSRPVAVMEIIIDHQALWESATATSTDSGLHLMLIRDGALISATNDAFLSQALENARPGIHHAQGCTLVIEQLALGEMLLCCAIPSGMTTLPTPQLLAVFAVLILGTLFSFLLVRLICQKQLRSLNALTARIDAISPDGTECISQEPEDEVERLSLHFDSMYQRLGESFQREKRMLYDDLTNELKPHFICNAMDMLRLQAEHYNQSKLAESILQINQYFRYSMLDSGASVSLAEEIDNALNYLKLVNVMREDKIRFDLTLDAWTEEHAGTALLPKMLLQPLLENAVRHGIKTKKNAYVGIQIMYDSSWLEINVMDNGTGLTPERLEQLNHFLSDENWELEKGVHVGLANVIRRLKLIYPHAHQVSISSTPYIGTTVKVRLFLEGAPQAIKPLHRNPIP